MKYPSVLCFLIFVLTGADAQQHSQSGIVHSFVISGPKTMEIDEYDNIIWEYDEGSRDISKLISGNYIITYANRILEVTPDKKIVWRYDLTGNDELMSAQRLMNGNTLVTELGTNPQLVEVSISGKIATSIPIMPETDNIHMQTRMARKLDNGHYLVPHRLMPFVKEYDKAGNLLQEFRLDGAAVGGPEAKNGAFMAVRLDNGNTVITCTSGNRIVVLDQAGELVWQVTTDELDGLLQDVCGLQVLKNGHFLVSCYGNQDADGIKMMEITSDKEIVWTYQNPGIKYIHTLQILTTNGIPE